MIRPNRNAKGKVTSYGVRVHMADSTWLWIGSFPTRKEAKEAEARAFLDRDGAGPARLKGGALVSWYLDWYKRNRKESSYDAARAALTGFRDDFDRRTVKSIDKQTAEDWAAKNRWRVPAVVSMFNRAVRRHEGVDTNPFAGLSEKGPGRRDTEPLSVEEVARLAECAGPLGPVVLFAAYSGLRQGEVFGLEWRDVDLENMRLQVRRRVYRGTLDLPKSNKPRPGVLLSEARDALLSTGSDRTGTVFQNGRGTYWSAGAFAYHWKGVVTAFGRNVAFHELRHFFGHHLYVTLDAKPRIVATQLGHSTPRLVEELYGHFKSGALDELDVLVGNKRRLEVVRDKTGTNDGVGE